MHGAYWEAHSLKTQGDIVFGSGDLLDFKCFKYHSTSSSAHSTLYNSFGKKRLSENREDFLL